MHSCVIYIHTSIVSEGHGIRACISFSERILAETDILNSITSFHLNQLKRRILCPIYCVLFKNNPSPGVWVTFFTVILVARPFLTTPLGHICTFFTKGAPSLSLQYKSIDDEPEKHPSSQEIDSTIDTDQFSLFCDNGDIKRSRHRKRQITICYHIFRNFAVLVFHSGGGFRGVLTVPRHWASRF